MSDGSGTKDAKCLSTADFYIYAARSSATDLWLVRSIAARGQYPARLMARLIDERRDNWPRTLAVS
jgi:hypothetical protein